MPVVDHFFYLGDAVAQDSASGDARAVDSRVGAASKTFGELRGCIFSSTFVSSAAKRAVY